jgi:hypothetical protein
MARPWGGGRPTPINYLTLDVRWLKRSGYLKAGTEIEVEQSIMGHVRRRIRIKVHDIDVELIVGDRRQYVPIVTTKQRLGGERQWFECDCGERAAILYGPRFACRRCRRIAYPSQRESPRFRALRRAQKIRAKLGGSMSMIEPFPERPKGMHWRTYHRVWARCLNFEQANLAGLAARFKTRAVGAHVVDRRTEASDGTR